MPYLIFVKTAYNRNTLVVQLRSQDRKLKATTDTIKEVTMSSTKLPAVLKHQVHKTTLT